MIVEELKEREILYALLVIGTNHFFQWEIPKYII